MRTMHGFQSQVGDETSEPQYTAAREIRWVDIVIYSTLADSMHIHTAIAESYIPRERMMLHKAYLVFLLLLALLSHVIISSEVAAAARPVSNGGSRSGEMAVSKISVSGSGSGNGTREDPHW
ncbi:hypothetical protein ACJRO7_029644 [Eucalyptus globulus]|uniref:Uncharacterized protein n=1 Tax=Eucalyptus globulus TaxID=34317 RepID=A0ABD3JAN9_EUCGL